MKAEKEQKQTDKKCVKYIQALTLTQTCTQYAVYPIRSSTT